MSLNWNLRLVKQSGFTLTKTEEIKDLFVDSLRKWNLPCRVCIGERVHWAGNPCYLLVILRCWVSNLRSSCNEAIWMQQPHRGRIYWLNKDNDWPHQVVSVWAAGTFLQVHGGGSFFEGRAASCSPGTGEADKLSCGVAVLLSLHENGTETSATSGQQNYNASLQRSGQKTSCKTSAKLHD